MTIDVKKAGAALTLVISGRVDTTTAPEVEKTLNANLDGVTDLVFDFTNVAYISSAGLRVLLSAQKRMRKQGTMKLTGVNAEIMEIFEVTGFVDFLDIE